MKKGRKARRSPLRYFGAVMLLWSVIICVMLVAVSAATVNVSGTFTGVENYGWLRFSAENGYASGSGKAAITANAIAVSATGYSQSSGCSSTDRASTTTLTIHNTQPSGIQVTFTTSGGTASASSPAVIPGGGSMTYTVTSGNGTGSTVTGTITITGIEPYYETYTTTFAAGANGSYTATYQGEACAVPGSHSGTNQYGYELTATPNPGYEFVSWANAGNQQLSMDNPYTYTATSSQTIHPLFRPEGSATYYILGREGVFYYYLDEAISAAGSSGTVVLYGSGSVRGSQGQTEFTVPSGVTLLLPYAAGQTGVDTSTATDGEDSTLIYANKKLTNTSTGFFEPETGLYLSLTIPAGTGINVANGGKLVVGGTLCGTTPYACVPAGEHSNLRTEGTITVQSGGVLSACGYILGGGQVNAQSGGAIYQPFSITDYGGGGYTTSTSSNSGVKTGESAIAPFVRYTMQNIQTRLHMDSGARMHGYCDLYTGASTLTSAQHNVTIPVVIGGASDTALLKLADGATLDAAYDAENTVNPYNKVGKTTVEITGGASMGTLELAVSVGGFDKTVSTSGVVFPLPYNYEFQLNGQGSTYTLGYSLGVLPGATLSVGEGAALSVPSGRLMIYDGLNDHGRATSDEVGKAAAAYNGGKQSYNAYPNAANLQSAGVPATGNLIMSGTLNIASGARIGGVVQASGDGARLVMDAGATAECATQMGLVGKVSVLKTYYFAGATVRTLPAQIIDTGTGKRTNIQAGLTYYSAAGSDVISDYTYTLYTNDGGSSEEHTEALNAPVEGSWYNYTVTVHMVLNGAVVGGPLTMYFAHGTDVSGMGYYSDLACTSAVTAITGGNDLYCNQIEASILRGGMRQYYPTLRNAVQDVESGETVRVEADLTVTSGIAVIKPVSLDVNGKTIAYTTTPFINSDVLNLDLNGGTITNCVDGVYAASPALSNNEEGAAVVDLNGGSILVQAPEGQAAQFNGVVNYGTLSVADTAGSGGIYCYGPLGADESGWKSITLTTTNPANCTATVSAEIWADTLGAEVIYTGIYNTGAITEISGGTIRSPMYGIYNGSASDVAYPQQGLNSLARAKSIVTTTARIGKISGGVIQGGWIGLMNNGASVNEITGGTIQSTGTMLVGNAGASYYGLYNGYGTVGDVSNASILCDAFTLSRYGFTFAADGTQNAHGTGTVTNTAYGICNYGYTAADATADEGYSCFVSTLGDLANCTIDAVGTRLTEGLLAGTYTATGTVSNVNGYGLYNMGGAVGNITGGSIRGNSGIQNRNLVYDSTVYNTGSSSSYTHATRTWRMVSTGVIGDIRDCGVEAHYQYALLNYGNVGRLCGDSTFTAYAKLTQGYAVYNHAGWYNGTVQRETITEREAYTNASGATAYREIRVTNHYDGSGKATGLNDAAAVWQSIPLPTIDSITDNVTIATVNEGTNRGWGYALNNGGRINSIGGGTGTVTIQTYVGDSATVNQSDYALVNSAYIGSIGDNVTLSADGERALQNNGNRLTQQVTEKTYVDDTTTTVKTTDVVSDYCAPACIGSIGAAAIRAGTQYGILNYGWLGDITGATITTETGAYGISNQGDSSYSYSHTLTYTTATAAPEGYNPDNPGYMEEYTRFGAKIGTIADTAITAGTSNAISNAGEIEGITGQSTLTATTTNALTNGDSYQTGYVLKRYNLGQTDVVNAARYITLEEKTYHYGEGGGRIGEISGSVRIQSGGNYGIYNSGTIGPITGASISSGGAYAISNNGAAYQARSTFRYLYGAAPMGTSQYVGETNVSFTKMPASIERISNVTATSKNYDTLYNLGAIDTIENSSLSTDAYCALYNYCNLETEYALNLPESADAVPAYLNWVGLNAAGNGYVFRADDCTRTYAHGVIGSIADTDFTAKTFSGSNGGLGVVYNAGEIGSITGGSITGDWSKDADYYGLYNADQRYSGLRTVFTDITADVSQIVEGYRVAQRLDTYVFPKGKAAAPAIGSIDGVTITNSRGRGLYNAGVINAISGGSISARTYALNNTGGYYTARENVQVLRGATWQTTTTQYFNMANRSYTREQAEIGTIDGVEISTNTAGYAVSNGGVIGAITNSAISSATERAISNTDRTAISYTNDYDNGYGGGAAGQFTLTSSTAGSVPTTDTTTVYAVGRIGLIGGGNTISGTTNVVMNSGEITAVDNTDAEGNVLTGSTITASTGVGLYNYRGLTVKETKVANATTSEYASAQIGTVRNIQITATSYAVQNGDGNATYPDVALEELGQGVEATSTNNHAVYNYAQARIGSAAGEEGGNTVYTGGVTGGIYTATRSGSYYALYNANTAAPICISAGDFKGGTNTDASQGRNYAIYQPDSTERQTYPENYSLTPAGKTETVTFMGQTPSTGADGYYYIGLAKAVAQIMQNGTMLKEYATLAAAVNEYAAGAPAEGGTDANLPYIQMTEDSEERGFTIGKDVYLDLNGHSVTLTDGTLIITAGYTLYGMDTATNGYTDTGYGKIVGTVSGDMAAYTETYRNTGGIRRYVKNAAATEDGTAETSFHRYNISVTSYRFHFDSEGDCNLRFGATFRGSPTVVELVEDMGFRVSKVPSEEGGAVDGWWVSQNGQMPEDFTNGYVLEGQLINLGANGDAGEFSQYYDIFGLLKFPGNEVAASLPRNLNYLWALHQYYYSTATEEEKAAIDAFVQKNSLTEAWNKLAEGE